MKVLLVILLLIPPVPGDGKSDPYTRCMPEGVELTEIVSAPKKVTVKQALQRMNARCRKGKLVDRTGKEIYIYRLIGCWGNPPEDYEEQLRRQAEKLEELKKKYAVIEISCTQLGP